MNRCQKCNLLSSDSSFDSDKNVSSVVEQKIKVFALGGLDENGKIYMW